MSTQRKVAIAFAVAILVLFVGAVWYGVWWVRNGAAANESTMVDIDFDYPGIIRSEAIAANLDKGGSIAYSSLSILEQRKWPGAQEKARALLKSGDSYMWLNAAFYLAALEDKESVPYLIKGLRHSAWRSYPQSAKYLNALTGEDYGTDFDKWKAWWEKAHPAEKFDFGSS